MNTDGGQNRKTNEKPTRKIKRRSQEIKNNGKKNGLRENGKLKLKNRFCQLEQPHQIYTTKGNRS